MGALLDQTKNYKAEFGLVFRSSAIFYIPRGVRTTISFGNYWKFKNGLDVSVIATVRDMDGRVVGRRPCPFEDGLVHNISDFGVEEGSVEIEAFGNTNMRIPYAAIMAIYEAPDSVTMVHAYGRNHSLIEIEDTQAVLQGREGCWSVKVESGVRNSAVFHCGHTGLAAQTATLSLIDATGAVTRREVELAASGPFATVVFDLDAMVPDYREVLGGRSGWASIHFDNDSAFTRLLVLWTSADGRQMQVTHSNFDYDTQTTNRLPDGLKGYMKVPAVMQRMQTSELVVYPRMAPGEYRLERGAGGAAQGFDHGFTTGTGDAATLEFSTASGSMPSRLVTALRGRRSDNAIDFECSLGIAHGQRPPKRFHWSTVSARLACRIHIARFEEIYPPADALFLSWSLYSARTRDVLQTRLEYDALSDIPEEIALDELFPDAAAHLGDAFGCISVFCPWGGLLVFTSLERGDAFTIEHSF